MAEEENELWEGVQIMSADELENISSTTDVVETNETVETTETTDSSKNSQNIDTGNNVNITPVTTKDTTGIKNNTDVNKDEQIQINAHGALIKDLISAGVITSPEEEEELNEMLKNANTDTIKNLISSSIEKGISSQQESWKSSFTGAKKRFLEIEDSFTDTDVAIQMAQRLEFLDSVSEEQIKQNPELQKQLYYQDLKSKNFSDSDALEAIQEADELDKLEEKSLKSLPSLKASAEKIVSDAKIAKQKADTDAKEKYTESLQKLMSSIDNKQEFVSGLKLNEISRNKIKSNINDVVHTDDDGKQYTSLMYKQKRNPIEFQMLINYYDTIGLFNIDKDGNFSPNITKLKNIAKTKASSELDQVLQNEDKQIGTRNSHRGTSKESGNILDFFDRAFGDKVK